jgi:hypothetical protein
MHYHEGKMAAPISVPTRPVELNDRDRDERQAHTADYLYQLFFFELYDGLTNPTPKPISNVNFKSSEFIEQVISLAANTARDVATGRLQLSFSTPYYAARQIARITDRNYSDPIYSQYSGFKEALRRIAIDLHILKQPLGKFGAVSDDELRIARASEHWVEELWLQEQVARSMQVLSSEQAAASVAKEIAYLDTHITPFNERGEKWILLSRFAALYALPDIPNLIGRAVNCALGYGWHKDLWMIDVLEAIADVHRNGAANGLPMLRQVVPIVDKITHFTDGDETDHVRSSLIEIVAKVSPLRMPSLYEHHVQSDEFRYAEEALAEHLKMANPESEVTLSLARTFVDYRDISTLSQLAARSSKMGALLADQVSFLGGMPPKPMEYGQDTSDFGRKGEPPDVTKFRPAAFSKLVARIDKSLGYERHGEVLRNWLLHWEKKGKGAEALKSVKDYFDKEDRTYTAERVLDDAFLVSTRVEGKKSAYPWLVMAHIHRNGWQSYWTSETEIETRLRYAANFYQSNWKKFISDTSVPQKYWRRGGHGFVMGVKYLVRFLLMVGQNKQAVDFTRSCIKLVREEVSDQPIPATPWFN